MRCYVDGVTHDGDGVARIDGKATFIPYAIPGELVEVQLTESRKSWQKAILMKVIESSPFRIKAPCLHYYECGGCSYQHVEYSHQLELKRRIVRDSLKRIGRIETEVNPVLGMDNPWHYRNKVTWHVIKQAGSFEMGYYRNNSRTLAGISECILISPVMQQYSRVLKNHLNELNLPQQCEITIRQSSVNGELMIVFAGCDAAQIDFVRLLNYQEVASVYSVDRGITRIHYGDKYLLERLGNVIFEISPLSFFQVNHQQTEKMLEILNDWAGQRPDASVLDAYCGTGSIALNLADRGGSITGVEYDKTSVKDAKRNAYLNGITNSRFIKGACEDTIPGLDQRYDIVILDPPRAGCKKEVVEAVLRQSPEQIIYVSCNPSTLARDLAIFVQQDYILGPIQPIDMFPQTSHVEVVTLLTRNEETK